MGSRFWTCVKSVFVILFSVSGYADVGPSVRWSGFVTQGYVHTDHYDFFGPSEDGSWDFRELGVNMNARMSSSLSAAAQMMSRRVGELDDGAPNVDFALLDYRFVDSTDRYWGARAGRIRSAYGLYSETRDVAFTRPSIILPQSIYSEPLRSLQMSADGAMVYGGLQVSEDRWIDIEFGAGQFALDESVEVNYLGANWSGRFDDRYGFQGRITYRDSAERFRAGFHAGQVHLGYKAGAVISPLEPVSGDIDIDFASLFGQFSFRRWQFSSEYLWLDTTTEGIRQVPGLSNRRKPKSYYLQLQYRVNSKWDLVTRFDKRDEGVNAQLPAALERQIFPSPYYESASSWMFGVGWRPSLSWLLRAEVHQVRGTSWLPVEGNEGRTQWHKKWRIFALQATYRF